MPIHKFPNNGKSSCELCLGYLAQVEIGKSDDTFSTGYFMTVLWADGASHIDPQLYFDSVVETSKKKILKP